MMRKFIALSCLVAFVVLLAGCGVKDAGSAGAAKQTATDSGAESTTKKKAPEGS
jgi:hypothetical protein